jgi:hypothetical protein
MAYIYDLSDTWNASGTTFYGIKMNVTNTASAAGSKLVSLQVGGTEYFGVDKNGDVRIGNGGDLKISSATGGDDSIIYNDAEDLYFNINGAVRAVITSSGNVLVGTSSTFDNVSYLKFQCLGGVSTKIAGTSLTSQMSFFNDNGRVGWIGTDGTTTSYNTSSDARMKENIADADSAGDVIDAIQVRKFDWKVNGEHQRYGFIAQELLEVAPEAVSAPEDEDVMMAVDYSKLVPLLVKELQALRTRVAQLEGN